MKINKEEFNNFKEFCSGYIEWIRLINGIFVILPQLLDKPFIEIKNFDKNYNVFL